MQPRCSAGSRAGRVGLIPRYATQALPSHREAHQEERWRDDEAALCRLHGSPPPHESKGKLLLKQESRSSCRGSSPNGTRCAAERRTDRRWRRTELTRRSTSCSRNEAEVRADRRPLRGDGAPPRPKGQREEDAETCRCPNSRRDDDHAFTRDDCSERYADKSRWATPQAAGRPRAKTKAGPVGRDRYWL